MDTKLFNRILSIDSTSGSERELAEAIEREMQHDGCTITRIPAEAEAGAPVNLLMAWGEPQVVYCTHLDTVPPYIAPTFTADESGRVSVHGRGSCDAKGQILAMLQACRNLAAKGESGFGLLLLYGEETGSYGAKVMNDYPEAEYVVVGEPTDGKMVSASKGTKAFEVTITGTSCHSGYPQHGVSAVEKFVDLVNELRQEPWPVDPVLGPTTYNIGKLQSDNPQNILSPRLTCRIYFRTTFASDAMVTEEMQRLGSCPGIEINALGGDTPMRYLTLPGFETTTVAFGSDAPQLHRFSHKMLCGPGSILVAHTPREHITEAEIDKATSDYEKIYYQIKQQGKKDNHIKQ